MKEEVLNYHRFPIPGKIEVIPSKKCSNQHELSLAYTPGVADPCLEIKNNPDYAYEYTGKGNLVAVISDGSAVLGLGNIGAIAGKPVMEGKSVLFKKFGGVNAFDIEINAHDPKKIIEIIKSLEPTFGGINLEDISSPRCFEIEEALIDEMDIPVFHDDQHGTAVIAAAAVLNGLDITGKKLSEARFAVSGAGSASVAIIKHLVYLGADIEKIFVTDTQGVLTTNCGRKKSRWHDFLFRKSDASQLSDIMKGADVFLGLSAANIVSPEMVKTMNKNPIILPMANPSPEIPYHDAKKARPDAIVGTGRSDYPNQVNNVLGFPAIFRGALDIRAKKITPKMKASVTQALIQITREKVPQSVLDCYGIKELTFGPDYIIPKPFDRRVLHNVASAIAKSGMEEGVSRISLNIEDYKAQLEKKYPVSDPLGLN